MNVFRLFMLMTVMAIAVTSCKKDKKDDVISTPPSPPPSSPELTENYFTVEGGTYQAGAIPVGTAPELNVTINENVLAGGSSIVTVESEVTVTEVYLGVSGVTGHITKPTGSKGTYELTIRLSQNLDDDFTIQISARTDLGVTPMFTKPMTYIPAGTGALQISLSFNQNADVDLHVVQPNGVMIYYANPGGYYYNENDEYVRWGLDVDSNAGCGIDGINKENIYFPEEFLQTGKYEVYVNLWSNCSVTVPIRWDVITTCNSGSITITEGSNPASGTYQPPSYNDRYVKAMEFYVEGSAKAPKKYTPIPLSETAKQKLEASKK